MQGKHGPPILVGQARKLVSNSSTPLFVSDNSNKKKNVGDFVLILINLSFGAKPMVAFTILYKKTPMYMQ